VKYFDYFLNLLKLNFFFQILDIKKIAKTNKEEEKTTLHAPKSNVHFKAFRMHSMYDYYYIYFSQLSSLPIAQANHWLHPSGHPRPMFHEIIMLPKDWLGSVRSD
jgi:hypothetical protein